MDESIGFVIPPEVLAVSDPVTIFVILVLSELLRPIVLKMKWFKDDPDRIIFVPLILGPILAFGLEYYTPNFSYRMWMRRSIINSVGAAGTFKLGKVVGRFFNASNATG